MTPLSPLPGPRFLAPPLRAVVERLAGGAHPGEPVTLGGVESGALPLLAALLPRALGRPLALIVPSREEAVALVQDAPFYARVLGAPDPPVHLLPALEPEPYLGVSPHLQVVVERAIALHAALEGRAAAVVIPAEALLLRVPEPRVFRSLVQTVAPGQRLDRDRLVRDLVAAGYRRQDLVGTAGEVAVRGGIVDVYSPADVDPFRIELFGDEVHSIRSFDPVTQRSAGERPRAVLLPLVPFPIEPGLDARLSAWGARLGEAALAALRRRREELRERGSFPGLEWFAPAAVSPLVDLLACLDGFLVAVVEPESTRAAVEKALAALEEAHREAEAKGSPLPSPAELALSLGELRERLETAPLRLAALGGSSAVRLATRPARRYEGRIKDVVADLAAERENGVDAVVVLPSEGEAERVEAMLSEYEVPYLEGERAAEPWRHDRDPPGPGRGRVAVATGRLAQGFRSPDLALAVLAAPEVFGGGLPPARRRKARTNAFASDFRDLRIGDLVVHVDHGIGRFQGLKTVEAGGATQEFMVLAYAEDDRLYVPLDRLDLVQKYSGAEGARPRIDKLGKETWGRVKNRVKAEIREMAEELLRLYATRRIVRGHAFSPDGLFQKEFEDAFPFQETADQAQAIADVKRDMESDRCMDRLLCGDVGYGKTEVAMRAAFKAVADGKQVAVLAPTTILAFQHFRTFTDRFKAFPVTIGLVSRFRSRKEIDDTLAALAEGKLDILIGTHRLLSRDVRFRDLGLLIVDEEQRFGVAHKEKLKQLSAGIDVLSMSATPIPRTLQMSLAGLRDMSVIETPPKDRLAIETAVLRWDGKTIKEGIKREMERGGQVYFVHNRIESIYAMADTLRRIAPFARLLVAHGQMKESELEDTMMAFLERRADILLATTIVENGLDLPNVNTIFINRANRLGLAQLYQLRGRVGRSDRPAYAYLLVPRDAELSPVARRRLHAIEEFTDLGSGFRIAALDLEIRGAGNVLGKQQHGHIVAVGFDLYMDLLDEAVRELKGEVVEPPATTLALGLDYHVPEGWIPDPNQRLMVYKRVAGLRSASEADELEREFADRFGELPQAARNLLDAARLKLEAQALGVVAIERDGKLARLRFAPSTPVAPARLVAFARAGVGRKLHPDGRLDLPVGPGREALDDLRLALLELG